MDNSCDCSVCLRTRDFYRFEALLPESERSRFAAWYSAMFDELAALTTEKEFEAFRNAQE